MFKIPVVVLVQVPASLEERHRWRTAAQASDETLTEWVRSTLNANSLELPKEPTS